MEPSALAAVAVSVGKLQKFPFFCRECGELIFIQDAEGKVFDPQEKWEKWDHENWVFRPIFLSIPPIFCLFCPIPPPLFSHPGSRSYIFHLDLSMIPHFPPCSPISPHFPPFFSVVLHFSETWFGELVSSVAVSADA